MEEDHSVHAYWAELNILSDILNDTKIKDNIKLKGLVCILKTFLHFTGIKMAKKNNSFSPEEILSLTLQKKGRKQEISRPV